MTNPTSKKNYKPLSVPERIKQLWNLYLEMSLDPSLEASAEHVKAAVLTLEHIRKIALDVTMEERPEGMHDTTAEENLVDEEEFFERLRKQQFGSVMKH